MREQMKNEKVSDNETKNQGHGNIAPLSLQLCSYKKQIGP